jgi:hypothetical protein
VRYRFASDLTGEAVNANRSEPESHQEIAVRVERDGHLLLLIREGRLDEVFAGPGRRDPWRKDGVWTTPLVAAVQGWVMTLAIELLLPALRPIRARVANGRTHACSPADLIGPRCS